MNQAKEVGRDAVAVFDSSMRTRVSERVELENDLRHAVELHQFHLVYQPIVRLPKGPVEGNGGADTLVASHSRCPLSRPGSFGRRRERVHRRDWGLGPGRGHKHRWPPGAAGARDGELYMSVNLSGRGAADH